MSEILFLVEQAPEGGYIARAFGDSIFTEADTLPELRQMVRDAVHCHFDEGNMPKVIRLHTPARIVSLSGAAICHAR